MRRIPTVSLLALALTLPAAASPDPWITDVDRALATADAGGRLVLVDLFAEWCGWCRVLDEEVFSDPRFLGWASDLVLLRVDTEDGGEGTALMERFEIGSLPTTLVLNARGVRIAEVAGYHPT